MVNRILIFAITVLCVADIAAQTLLDNAFYIGDSACQPCHENQSETFRKNTHNNAYTDIKDTERYVKLKANGEEGTCLKCHVTGYGEKGGFIDDTETPEMAKVGCEGCHGPGSEHVRVNSENIDMKEETMLRKPDCGKCHLIHSHEG